MKYIVYLTTNNVNKKIYIGVHKTDNPEIFDGYYGCGVSLHNNYYYVKNPKTPFQYAIAKYGLKHFTRIILKEFDNLQDALDLEAWLVTKEFINRKDTYNIALGGGYAKTYYPVNQFDKNGNYIKTWDNCKEASEVFGVSETSINNAKLHKSSSCGYFWSEDLEINIKEFSYKVTKKTYKYSLDGEFIESFETLADAAKSINVEEKKLSRAILNEYKCEGFYFSYSLKENFTPRKFTTKGKIFYIYDLDGNFIISLPSGPELQKFYSIKSYGNLKQAILQNRPYKNTQISLEKVDKMPKCDLNQNSSKKVGKYDLEGNLLETFDSIREAKKCYGNIDRVLKGYQKQTKGFIFKYID